MKPPFKIGALGEIAIRCRDIAAMERWYSQILGLELLEGGHSEGIVFFKIAQGYHGHTSVLALFHHEAGRPDIHPRSESRPETGARSSLHHIALSLAKPDQDRAIAWLKDQGIAHNIQYFAWIGWRGVFLTDPEGNTVELVAYDDSFKDTPKAS